MRLGEALVLRRSDVDLAGRAIRLRDGEARARTVHLGAASFAILNATPASTRHNLCRSAQHNTPGGGCAGGSGCPMGECTIFGIRAALLPLVEAFVVRDLFGHKTLAMTGRCVERAADMVCTIGDAASNSVANALNAGTTSPAEAIELAERQ
jgi:hypothetical protein